MLQSIFVLNTIFGGDMLSIIAENPVRIVLICIGILVGIACIKQRHILSCLVILVLTILLTIITFTDLFKNILKSIPIAFQYGIVVFLTILFCIIYEYEASRKER
ncbi:hypothetical protein [Priestia megaterium]|uniref:hypothetical protein n=1 Tax=Priestia megaterium TaxID=1404 RepID=UPI001A950C47|nr:hypothetical protein [Priestia megaterium]QSX23911.1 hypothetical protein J0P05_30255 [Priestia megaterium]